MLLPGRREGRKRGVEEGSGGGGGGEWWRRRVVKRSRNDLVVLGEEKEGSGERVRGEELEKEGRKRGVERMVGKRGVEREKRKMQRGGWWRRRWSAKEG